MSLVEQFDVYADVLKYGNRTDIEDGEWDEDGYDYASWEAHMADWESGKGEAVVKVYNDDEERKFLISWEEIR